MIETKFKALTYAEQYMDVGLLAKGLYESGKPHLYPFETTIDALVAGARLMSRLGHKVPESYFENLRKCQLTEVLVILLPTTGRIQAGGAFQGSAQYLPMLDDDKQETPVTTPTGSAQLSPRGNVLVDQSVKEDAEAVNERIPRAVAKYRRATKLTDAEYREKGGF